MATKKKMLQAAAGNAGGGAGLDITDVFSTYLYDGTGSNLSINNGIDLDGEGGMVWIKGRIQYSDHFVYDTERGAGKNIRTNKTLAQETRTDDLKSFNSNGFSLGDYGEINTNYSSGGVGYNYASWTWRKAPKFFDVVTYTGTGSAQNISHNLGSTPGMVVVKNITTGGSNSNWTVWHNGLSDNSKYIRLNSPDAEATASNQFNGTAPTSTVFSVGTSSNTNASGDTYVAYLFAHNDGDGEFGPSGDQDIIKCGSYAGNNSANGPEIDLGFEPQWIMIKTATSSQSWWMHDTMRGIVTSSNGSYDARLKANATTPEDTNNHLHVTPTGFKITSSLSGVNESADYIYMAIRRGPLAVPEDATEVFEVSTRNASEPAYTSGFPVDFAFARAKNTSNNWDTGSRLQQGQRMFTNLTNAEASNSNMMFDYQEGWSAGTGASTNYLSWMWKRAPGYFDVVAYSGNSTAGRTVSHNLGVAPEMMWVKARNLAREFVVYHKDIGNNKAMDLETATAAGALNYWNYTTPIDTVFTVGDNSRVNDTGYNYIAYLFASAPNVSKCGSYTGNGSSQTIDCGFTSGARFILVKRTDSTGDWYVWDTERGIVAGNDPYLELNTTDAEVTSTDWIDPDNSGFIVNGTTINASSAEYIFYAIA